MPFSKVDHCFMFSSLFATKWGLSIVTLLLFCLQWTAFSFQPSRITRSVERSRIGHVGSPRSWLTANVTQEGMSTQTFTGPNSFENVDAIPSIEDLPLAQLALAGSVTTFTADLAMHPVDCIKTIQQSDAGLSWSILEAARYLYEQDGISGFFHGFLAYAMADAAAGAVKFGVWETWKKRIYQDVEPAVWSVMMGAALAFFVSSFVITPGEFLKQQLQMSHYDGIWDAVQGVAYVEDGSFNLNGLFVGYDGILCRDIPYTIMELGLYDQLKRTLERFHESILQDDEQVIVRDRLLCAAVTGAIAAVATTPMDVIKTKLMVDNYSSFADCLMLTVERNGFAVLFSGLFARLSWIVPFTVIYLPTYDFLKSLMWKRYVGRWNVGIASIQSQPIQK